MTDDLAGRVRALERANRRLTLAMGTLVLLAGAGAVAGARPVDPRIRVSELEVVDARGVVRARLGGELPDPVIKGQTIRRGSQVSGLMLYDDTGQERGGYVTSDGSGNIFLTLDSRHEQTALFVADTAGSTVLRLWRGDDEAELRTDSEGPAVRLTRAGRMIFRQPTPADPRATSLCRELRAARQRAESAALERVCLRHMSESDCRLCLTDTAQDPPGAEVPASNR